MPTIQVNDIHMYYEARGAGAPLVLIPGLSSDVSEYEYQRLIADLTAKYQVIALDNRGAGRTDKPDIPYTIAMMADDTAGLLAALGIARAHVLGISLGGRIAVALALAHPAQVQSLILVSTCVQAQAQRSRANRLLNVALRLPLWRRLGSKYPQPYYAVLRQREASRTFDATARLSQIRVPTLILHGKKDRLAPYPCAQAMHAAIHGAQLVPFAGGHLFLFFHPRPFLEAIFAFLP